MLEALIMLGIDDHWSSVVELDLSVGSWPWGLITEDSLVHQVVHLAVHLKYITKQRS